MRYGNPSIEEGIKNLVNQGVNEIILIPLYPQFAMATTETILVLAEEVRSQNHPHYLLIFYNRFTIIQTILGCFQKAFKKT